MLKPVIVSLALLVIATALGGCATTNPSAENRLAAHGESPNQQAPLGVGDSAAQAALRTPSGDHFDVGRAYRQHPTVLVFYRGGWCPYCNTHLAELAQIEPDLHRLGFKILAVSPDRPEKLREAIDEHGFDYRLLSDQDMRLARAFGIAFRVDNETVERYQGFGIDLQAASGRSHYELPVPAVYLIDRDGVIRFAHRDEDYKQRMSGDALIEAARNLASR